MAKFFITPKLSYDGKNFLLNTLKPLLKRNNLVEVRKKIDNTYDDHKNVQVFLLSNLGEDTYFQGSDRIFRGEFFRLSLLEKIVIPEGIVRIEDGAFGLCTGLEYVFIPKSVKVIGKDAFRGCKMLSAVEIEDGQNNSLYISDDAFDGSKCKVYVKKDRLNFEPGELLKPHIQYR